MADIPIYPGSSSFATGSTPFGFYDTDTEFQADADKVTLWCARRLGWPIVDIELQDVNFYACFEEAVTVYGNEVYRYKIRENFLSMEGNVTGSQLNTEVITPNLGGTIRIADAYGTEAGVGGTVEYYTGSIVMNPNQQTYDLNAWADASASLAPGDSIEIKRVFYESPPALVRFFDPYAGSGTGLQSMLETFGFGNFTPGVNFMLMPIYADILKLQAIELNDQVRKSAYSFELVNNKLKIFPIPQMQTLLFFHYVKKYERNSVIQNANASGSLVTNISNVPYANPNYSQINSVGREWIFQYTLALVKELLGYVRGKYQNIPIPGDTVILNHSDLLSDAESEKRDLVEQLRATLDEVSRKAQLEKKAEEGKNIRDTLGNSPMLIFIG